jgi:hypothetical protein
MPIVDARVRRAVGGRGHRIHHGGRRSRVSEKFGDLSEPPLFVLWELRDVLLREFGDLIWHRQRSIHAGGKTPGGAASLSFREALDDILF